MRIDLVSILQAIIEFLRGLSLNNIVQIFAVLAVFLYLFFAFALWRQTQLMSRVVEVKASPLLKLLSILHLVLAVIVFGLTFVLL